MAKKKNGDLVNERALTIHGLPPEPCLVLRRFRDGEITGCQDRAMP
jgi:hypothetical protein